MGLDINAYKIKASEATQELFYWRKHRYLKDWLKRNGWAGTEFHYPTYYEGTVYHRQYTVWPTNAPWWVELTPDLLAQMKHSETIDYQPEVWREIVPYQKLRRAWAEEDAAFFERADKAIAEGYRIFIHYTE